VVDATPGETMCGQCGCLIPGESPTADPADRQPCPECGSTSRTLSGLGAVEIHVTATGSGTVVTYPEGLLEVAEKLIADRQFSIAVVVVHMACEVATERCLSAAFDAAALQHLEDPISDLLNGYNLANDRNRKLYAALTGDAVEQRSFWSSFRASATRRNRIVHGSEIADAAAAEASYVAASAMVEHLAKQEAALRAS